jgi:alpha-glucosidase (family GH31 glycosyl hydrolase)
MIVTVIVCDTGGATHGVLLMNSHGMDIVLTQTQISYRVIGGVLDFYFFMGPTPHAVLEQLTSIVGRPFMPPYWSMGLMNSKCALTCHFHTPNRTVNHQLTLESSVPSSVSKRARGV